MTTDSAGYLWFVSKMLSGGEVNHGGPQEVALPAMFLNKLIEARRNENMVENAVRNTHHHRCPPTRKE